MRIRNEVGHGHVRGGGGHHATGGHGHALALVDETMSHGVSVDGRGRASVGIVVAGVAIGAVGLTIRT